MQPHPPSLVSDVNNYILNWYFIDLYKQRMQFTHENKRF